MSAFSVGTLQLLIDEQREECSIFHNNKIQCSVFVAIEVSFVYRHQLEITIEHIYILLIVSVLFHKVKMYNIFICCSYTMKMAVSVHCYKVLSFNYLLYRIDIT